jgi:hypothetical protein
LSHSPTTTQKCRGSEEAQPKHWRKAGLHKPTLILQRPKRALSMAPWDWREAQIAANAPTGDCVIKGNISHGQKIYYMPFHNAYRSVKVNIMAGERWFCKEGEALAAGRQRAQR